MRVKAYKRGTLELTSNHRSFKASMHAAMDYAHDHDQIVIDAEDEEELAVVRRAAKISYTYQRSRELGK